MTDKPTDRQTPGEHAREVMNDLLKTHTVCGELITQPTTKAAFLATHPADECKADLAHKKDDAPLRSIHQAIAREAAKDVRVQYNKYRKEGLGLGCFPDTAATAASNYYRAGFEVLGVIPKSEWASGQTDICNLATTVRRLFTPAPAEVVPDHGLTCAPGDTSLANLDSCKRPPKTR
ncbi:MAG: hypothetical protein V4735_09865 [Pseudomonadota bacterium]